MIITAERTKKLETACALADARSHNKAIRAAQDVVCKFPISPDDRAELIAKLQELLK